MRKRKPLEPIDQACLECAHRMVCGGTGNVTVGQDGTIYSGAAFKLEPSRDSTDALVVVVSKAMKLYLGGVDFAKLRDDFIETDVGEVFANSIYDHLVSLSDDEWSHIRDRVEWYVNDNAHQATFDTDKQGES
ncbi:hypothetical protein [Thioclava sp.]|uniref:hypothetical protein n=1 Tax=Thioclava sp. TaxID=1933450 RepID=UPI003AA9978C